MAAAQELGAPVLAALRASALVGVPPDVMGIGPAVAIPAVLLGNVLKGRQNEVLRMLEHAALTAINLRCDRPSPEDGQKQLAAVATVAPASRKRCGSTGAPSMRVS